MLLLTSSSPPVRLNEMPLSSVPVKKIISNNNKKRNDPDPAAAAALVVLIKTAMLPAQPAAGWMGRC